MDILSYFVQAIKESEFILFSVFSLLGYSLEQQKSLFDNIKPLFANKPLLIVANKSDIWKDNLSQEKLDLLEGMRKEVESETILEMSNKDDEDSVMNVKIQACEMLLQHRVEQKFKSKKVAKTK